mmetsp:Transcript_560/g.635  ORF Transcript_560/g.635 Transcript_560/m.635 type:complete len:667 (+) Transcript_560:1-2001(+)
MPTTNAIITLCCLVLAGVRITESSPAVRDNDNDIRFSGRAKSTSTTSSPQQEHRELSPGNTASARIIGGIVAPEGRYPYAASLETSQGSHICGGSLVAKDFVLTAAHCLDEFTFVTVGQYDRFDAQGEKFVATNEYIHPNYFAGDFPFDFLLVKLNGASAQEPVTLNRNPSIPYVDQTLTVMGWGVNDPLSKQVAQVLTLATVHYETNEQCKRSKNSEFNYDDYITDDMLCASDEGEDSCQGDSGGPLVVRGSSSQKDVLVGVVSWGYGCGEPTFPGVYARVSAVQNWIETTICQNSDYPPSFCNNSPPTPAPFAPVVSPTMPVQNPTQAQPTAPAPTPSPPTPPPPTPPPPTPPVDENAKFPVTIRIAFDDYPEELGWRLRRIGSNPALIQEVQSGTYKTPGSTIVETVMVREGGLYSFDIYDLVGDGTCCKHGSGGYEIYLGTTDVTDEDALFVRESGDYEHNSEHFFIASLDPPLSPSGDSFLSLEITFDAYPTETAWVLEAEHIAEEDDGTGIDASVVRSGSGDDDLLKYVVDYRPHSTYQRELAQQTITEVILIPDTPKGTFRTFTFTFIDTAGDGICCQYGDGSYALYKGSANDGIVIVNSQSPTKEQESTSFALSGKRGDPTVVPEPVPSPSPRSSASGNHRWMFVPASLILLSLWNIL